MRIAESELEKLWRKVVFAIFKDRCFFCGAHKDSQEIEIHHAVKRRHWLLKYNWRIGVPCCKWEHYGNSGLGMSCHRFAETHTGRYFIDIILEPNAEYIRERSGSAKQWLTEHGKTKDDYKYDMAVELTLKFAELHPLVALHEQAIRLSEAPWRKILRGL